jgi:predicted DNA-binding transcriptional regulator AlpA
MLATTIEIIRSGLKADPSLNPADRTRILAAIRNGTFTPTTGTTSASEPRLVRRAEAARRLGCSMRLVDRLAKDGILPKRRLPNRQRAAGFLESDLNALIAGRTA